MCVSVCLNVCLSVLMCVSVCLNVCLFVLMCVFRCINASVSLRLYLFIYHRAVTGSLDARASGARRDVRGPQAAWTGPKLG